MSHDVFISYSDQDKSVADALCANLESNQVRCWIAPRDVLPGAAWVEAIIDAIDQSRLMVLVYSSHSNLSPQVVREVERAVSKEIPIIPFRIEDVPLSKSMEYLISRQHWLDALTPPLEKHIERLVETVNLLAKEFTPQQAKEMDPKITSAREAAQHGDPDAMNDAGICYRYGIGVRQNTEKALEWFRKGAERGCTKAMIHVGEMYEQGEGVSQDTAKAEEWWKQALETCETEGKAASQSYGYYKPMIYPYGLTTPPRKPAAAEWYQSRAENGNSTACCLLGLMYYLGLGVPVDDHTAFIWFYRGARAGSARSMFNVGMKYLIGSGVEKDHSAAIIWLHKSAENGYPLAALILGEIFENDPQKAISWYQKAADLGNATGLTNIGIMYHRGLGVEQDYAKAFEYYQKAADLGEVDAMLNIGAFYFEGIGVTRDENKAKDWFLNAADKGSPLAMQELGKLYYQGVETKQDLKLALQWFLLAAEAGDALSMCSVAIMYYKGEGAEQNIFTATEWFTKAAQLGNLDAMFYLGKIYILGEMIFEPVRGIEWLKKAADQEHVESMYVLGTVYEGSNIVTKDMNEAIKWYQHAAEHGYTAAKERLAALIQKEVDLHGA